MQRRGRRSWSAPGWAHLLGGAPRGAARRGSPSRSPAPTSTRWPATRWPGPPGCRPRCTTRSATRWRPDRCWSRRRGCGYAAALACERCRTPARCRVCAGPAGPRGRPPRRRPAAGAAPPTRRWACPECGHRGLRAPVVGEARTAEELGRAFAGAVVRTSGGDRVLADGRRRAGHRRRHPGGRAGGRGRLRRGRAARHLAGARPGPPARRGGGAAPLGQRRRPGPRPAAAPWSSATRPTRPSRRWCAGTRPASPAREADAAARGAPAAGLPAGHDHRRARRRRRRAHPARPARPASSCSARCRPDPTGESRAVVRVPRATALDLSHALGEVQRVRSARKLDAVRIQVDPPTL